MDKKNYNAVDLFKWICAWLVIYIHLQPVLEDLPVADKLICQGLCRIAVPFFFAASAFFLFRKMGTEKSNGPANRRILWSYCSHLLKLYTLCLLINNLYYAFYWHHNGLPQKLLIDFLYGYFLKGDVMHLWYLIASVYAAPVVYLLWRRGRKALIAGCLVLEVLCLLDWPYRFLPIFSSSVYGHLVTEANLVVSAFYYGVPMMCLGALCLTDHKKRSCRQWGLTLLCVLPFFAAEIGGLYLYYGQRLAAGGMITRIPLIYCLLNWLLSAELKLPFSWLGKAFRLNSTWIYCSHYLIYNLYHWFFGYRGIPRYLIVGCLSVISGIPYVAFKLLRNRRKVQTSIVEERVYE